jgi:integrase
MRGASFRPCDILSAIGAICATPSAWPWCWRARQRDTAGTAAAGHLGCRARQPTRLVGFRPKGAAKSCRPATVRPQVEPRPPTAGHPGRSSLSAARARPRCSRPGPSGPARRRCALEPTFGTEPIAAIREPHVRRWRKQLLDAGTSAVTVAKAYRLLRAIMGTAVDDRVIKRNPCQIKGASQETSAERPVLTIAQVFALADAVGPRYRAFVLLAVFGSLRWGELAALRRCDVDVGTGTVRVSRQLTEISGYITFGPPKSVAGMRTVALPDLIVPILRSHLDSFTQPEDDALIFTSPTGKPLRHGLWRSRVWVKATSQIGLPGPHFHDLRHAGNMLAAESGATLRELMDRMGHSTTRAALIYLHGSDARQREIADALGRRVEQQIADPSESTDGSIG